MVTEPFRISHEDSVLAQAGTLFHLALVRAEGSTDPMLHCEVKAARKRLIRVAHSRIGADMRPILSCAIKPIPDEDEEEPDGELQTRQHDS